MFLLNILVCLDSNYINPLKVMLYSLFSNNENSNFDIYLMHSKIPQDKLNSLNDYIVSNWPNNSFYPIKVSSDDFKNAPVVSYYSEEMYYRLFAHKYLPKNMERILYLDPDILVINEINDLYNVDFGNNLFAACHHNKIFIKGINKIRLLQYQIEEYYNSGVLMMNLTEQRKRIEEKEIYDFIEKNKAILILPDQDILNSLYSKDIKDVDEILYNYDTRFYTYYKFLSKGKVDMDYIFDNTVILHFCGKKKPWKKPYSGEFYSLYKHYQKQVQKLENK